MHQNNLKIDHRLLHIWVCCTLLSSTLDSLLKWIFWNEWSSTLKSNNVNEKHPIWTLYMFSLNIFLYGIGGLKYYTAGSAGLNCKRDYDDSVCLHCQWSCLTKFQLYQWEPTFLAGMMQISPGCSPSTNPICFPCPISCSTLCSLPHLLLCFAFYFVPRLLLCCLS